MVTQAQKLAHREGIKYLQTETTILSVNAHGPTKHTADRAMGSIRCG